MNTKVVYFGKKSALYLKKHPKEILIIFLMCSLLDYYFYSQEASLTHKTGQWNWPIYTARIKDKLNKTARVHQQQQQENNNVAERKVQLSKIILFNKPLFGEEKEFPIDPDRCGGRCEVSYDRDYLDQAEAVIFHVVETNGGPILPQRFPDQLYVWLNQESAATTYNNYGFLFHHYDNVFNLTMTFRRDSDIYFPYNTSQAVQHGVKPIKEEGDLQKLLQSKKGLAAWVVGNCHFSKGGGWRVRLALRILLSGFNLEIYGYSVFNPMPGWWWDLPNHLSPYKFYLSFENSFHCKDYITEKVWWNAFQAGVVPVIWGPTKQDAAALLPLGSYILAEDFDTVSDLVKYLNYLDQNDDEYLKYFQWRKTILSKTISGRKTELSGSDAEITGFCQLCKKLYDDDRQERIHGQRPRHVVASIQQWWYLTENEECLSPRSVIEYIGSYYYRSLLIKEIWIKSYTHRYVYACLYIVLILFLVFSLKKKRKKAF